MLPTAKNDNRLFVFIAGLALVCYSSIGYAIPRTSFQLLLVPVIMLFVLYILVTGQAFANNHFKKLLLLAFLSRLVFLFAVPALSDDYFRFIWDGVLTNHSVNPYNFKPVAVNAIDGRALSSFMLQLKDGINSLPYYSPYPPVLQFIFFLGVKPGGYNVLLNLVVMRLLALLAEGGTVLIAVKMLDHFKMSRYRVLFYALNPLVIIELAGNLHGEVFLLFFCLLSFYLLVQKKYLLSAIFLGLAVSTKLLPLVFLPAIVSFLGMRKGWVFGLIMLLTVTVSFLPFSNGAFLQHIGESVGYYFQKFEFNASIYYVLRWMGYDLTGFNLIYVIGKLLPVLAFSLILVIAFYKRIETPAVFFERLLFTLLGYYLFSLIVHPWYITVLVMLSVFTKQRFALYWSGLIVLTYSTYMQKPYHEILWVTALEYILLSAIIYKEITAPKIRTVQ